MRPFSPERCFDPCGGYDRERPDLINRFRQGRGLWPRDVLAAQSLRRYATVWRAPYATTGLFRYDRSIGDCERGHLACWIDAAVMNTRICWPAAAGKCSGRAMHNYR